MRLSIKVTPNAKKPEIKKISETTYEIRLDAPAERGRANARLIDVLADYLGVSKSSVRIVRGHRTRNKIVDVSI